MICHRRSPQRIFEIRLLLLLLLLQMEMEMEMEMKLAAMMRMTFQ
jgi:hypothetical protein